MRAIRNICKSKKVNKLSAHAERFFMRLLLCLDDFGNMTADLALLKAELFPLLPSIRTSDITSWLRECEVNGLILVYVVADDSYIHVFNFKQKMRWPKARYPAPPDLKEKSTKKEKEVEVEVEEREKASATLPPSFNEKIFFETARVGSKEFFPQEFIAYQKRYTDIHKMAASSEEKAIYLQKNLAKFHAALSAEISLFKNYYSARNWQINGVPVTDCAALFNTWLARKKSNEKSISPSQKTSSSFQANPR